MYAKVFVILLVTVCSVYSFKRLPFPSYLNRCSRSDPKINECCLKNGKEAIPFILKGDRKYDIPNMLPLLIPSVTIDSGSDLFIAITDLNIYNLENADLKKFKFDFESKKIDAQVFAHRLELIGKYDINGRILVLPIQGKGDINLTAIDFLIDYHSGYNLVTRDGEEFATVSNSRVEMTMKRAYFHLTNLFNGNKELGEQTNKVLNKEWEQIVDTLKPALSKALVEVANRIINGFVQHIPFNEIFLP